MPAFNDLSAAAKVALIAGGGTVLYFTRYMVGHVFNVMLLIMVLAGIVAIVQQRRQVKQRQAPLPPNSTTTEQWHPTNPQTALPPTQPASQPFNTHTYMQNYLHHPHN